MTVKITYTSVLVDDQDRPPITAVLDDTRGNLIQLMEEKKG